jgi:hypothetical protein
LAGIEIIQRDGFWSGGCNDINRPTSIITPHSFEKRNSEHRQYHGSTNLPLMVSPLFALQRAANTMKSTIDTAVLLSIDLFFYYYKSMY